MIATYREYETILILRPEIPDDAVERVKGRILGIVEKQDGKIIRIDEWGKRKLAYEVDKHTKGIYLYFLYLGLAGAVEEVERNCKLWDDVMRFMTVKVDEDVDVNARPVEISDEDRQNAADAASKPPPEALPPDYTEFEQVTGVVSAPQDPVEEAPEVAAEAAPEAAPEVAEAAPEVVEEAAEAVVEVAAEPEAEPEAAPEVAEAAPEAAEEAAPEVAEAAPEAAEEAAPEVVAEAPEAAEEAAPEAADEATPEVADEKEDSDG